MEQKPDNKNQQNRQGHHEHPLPNEISTEQRELNRQAHETADKDMDEDATSIAPGKNDDLDEGETARLGDNAN